MLDRLPALSGARIETRFTTDQVRGQRQALKPDDGYAMSGNQPELKQLAEQAFRSCRST